MDPKSLARIPKLLEREGIRTDGFCLLTDADGGFSTKQFRHQSRCLGFPTTKSLWDGLMLGPQSLPSHSSVY